MSDFSRLIAPFVRRIGNLLARGTVAAVNAATKMQSLQMRLLAGEVKDAVEHFEPYGFTSNPKPGAEGVAVFLDGDRSHGIVLVVADRRYRLKSLASGEMAIHDDQGQKVHLTRGGIVIDGAALPIVIQNAPTVTVKAATKVRMETPLLEVTGEIKDNTDTTGKTMSGMRTAYNGHTHTDPQGGSVSTPTPAM